MDKVLRVAYIDRADHAETFGRPLKEVRTCLNKPERDYCKNLPKKMILTLYSDKEIQNILNHKPSIVVFDPIIRLNDEYIPAQLKGILPGDVKFVAYTSEHRDALDVSTLYYADAIIKKGLSDKIDFINCFTKVLSNTKEACLEDRLFGFPEKKDPLDYLPRTFSPRKRKRPNPFFASRR